MSWTLSPEALRDLPAVQVLIVVAAVAGIGTRRVPAGTGRAKSV